MKYWSNPEREDGEGWQPRASHGSPVCLHHFLTLQLGVAMQTSGDPRVELANSEPHHMKEFYAAPSFLVRVLLCRRNGWSFSSHFVNMMPQA